MFVLSRFACGWTKFNERLFHPLRMAFPHRATMFVALATASGISIGDSACQTCEQTEHRTAWPSSAMRSLSIRNTVSQFGQVRSMSVLSSPVVYLA